MSIAPIALFACLIVFMLLKIPIAWSLGLASIIAILLDGGFPLAVAAQRMFTGADIFSLLAIPFFILAGDIMVKGGLSSRLVGFADSLVGWLSGGLSLVSILSCGFFAAISGSSVATTAAIGGLMCPEMEKRGYPKDYSAAVQAIGGTLGIVIPPSIVFIMYGTATNVSIADLLMSGVIPGLIACIALCLLAYFIAKTRNYPRNSGFTLAQVGRTFKSAILALLMPIIILGGIYAGIFTPTESAVIAVVYGLIISMFVYREMSWQDLFRVFVSSARSTANLMILVISAQLFGWLITMFNVPTTVTAYVMSVAGNAQVFLFFAVILLIVCGMFMEVGATVLILAPIMAPMAAAFGVDPVHFGLLMVFVLAMGQATPPFGTTLFVAASITREPVFAIARQLMPFIACEILCAFLFAYVPILATFLPSLMK